MNDELTLTKKSKDLIVRSGGNSIIDERGHFHFTASGKDNPHIAALEDDKLKNSYVFLSIELSLHGDNVIMLGYPGVNTERAGYVEICHLSREAGLHNAGVGEHLVLTTISEGHYLVTVRFLCLQPELRIVLLPRESVGLKVSEEVPNYSVRAINIVLSKIPQDTKIRLVDIGARGGIGGEFQGLGDFLVPFFVEPEPNEARLLQGRLPQSSVLQFGLHSAPGRYTLNVLKAPSCSSILEPNLSITRRYSNSHIFEPNTTVEVDCVRYDQLVQRGQAPLPDIVKIDVQGLELEVLKGFGDILNRHVLAIELEVHFYQLYKKQALLHEVVDYLGCQGFGLRALRPQGYFSGELVEANAFFSRREFDDRPFSNLKRTKLHIINNLLRLPKRMALRQDLTD